MFRSLRFTESQIGFKLTFCELIPCDVRCGWKPHLPVSRMVGAVSNCAYAMRLETAPTGPGENIESPNYFPKPHLVCVLQHYIHNDSI